MDYPENEDVIFCLNKKRSSEPFLCLDLCVTDKLIVLESKPEFLYNHYNFLST